MNGELDESEEGSITAFADDMVVKTEDGDDLVHSDFDGGGSTEAACGSQHLATDDFNDSKMTVEASGFSDSKSNRTFRDVFNLDNQMSDESSLGSFSDVKREHHMNQNEIPNIHLCSDFDLNPYAPSAGNIPDIPVLKKECDTPEIQGVVNKDWDTQKVYDFILERSTDSGRNTAFLGIVDEAEEVYTRDRTKLNVSVTLDDKSLNDTGRVDDVPALSTASSLTADISEQLAETSMMEDGDTPSIAAEGMDDDMACCEEVLKVLDFNLGLGLAQFVLLKKVNMSKDKIEFVLQKCVDLKLIAGSKKLWKITLEGQEYLKNKFGGAKEIKSSTPEPVRVALPAPQEPKTKLKYIGPPPSPMDLIRSRSNAESVVSNSVSLPSGPSSGYTEVSTPPLPLTSLRYGHNPLLNTSTIPKHTNSSFANQIEQQTNSNLIKIGENIGSSILNGNKTGLSSMNTGLWDSSGIKGDNSPQNQTSNSSMPLTGVQGSNQRLISSTSNVPTEKCVIPSKYANYPNQSTTEDCFKSITQTKKMSALAGAAFSKGPPPTPMDILTKGLKKTDISPQKSVESVVSSRPGMFQNPTTTSNSVLSGRGITGLQNSTYTSNGPFQSFQRNEPTINSQSGGFQPGPMSLGFDRTGPRLQGAGLTAAITRPNDDSSLQLALSNESFNALNKNPISALMEFAQSRKQVARLEVISQRGSSHKPT